MPAQSYGIRGKVRPAALVVCLLGSLAAADVAAQPVVIVDGAEARSLAKACGRTGSFAACAAMVRGRLAGVADAILAELEVPVAAATPAAGSSTSRIVWDGTFAHPHAPSFYTLRSYVSADVPTPQQACAQLPAALQADRNLLWRLTCNAERELLAAGPDKWPEEMQEFERVRALVAACLPPGISPATPCATP